jgi:L-alanine-DL-glutamate epimerase-like enolase superfamily enzyme
LQAWKDFVNEGDIIEKGWVTVTDRPGIGVEMNDAAARKLVLRGTKWFDEA